MSVDDRHTVTVAEPGHPPAAHSGNPYACIVGACALIAVFVASGAPIPLFPTYSADLGFDKLDLAIASLGYMSAAVVTLLVFGRMSNRFGRKPVAYLALAATALGCALLIVVRSPEHLLVARLLQGVACGLAPAGLGSYVADTAPNRWS